MQPSRKPFKSLNLGRSRQQGAATIIVVMILFFVLTLAAAYASRNLIFEQRTASNQYKSTSSLEAAEAGIEWAVTMLNSGRIDATCRPSTDVTNVSFRQRYLRYDENGALSPNAPAGNVWMACIFNGTSWDCNCPDPATPTLPTPLPEGSAAFAVKFSSLAVTKPGTIRIDVNGCTSSSLDCLTAVLPTAFPTKCQSTVCAMLSQFPSLRMIPTAPVTAGRTIEGTRLAAFNADVQTGGITIHSGGDINPAVDLILGSAPGMPPSLSTRHADMSLFNLDSYSNTCDLCLFSSVFGLPPGIYKEQQGVVQVNCGTTGCTSAASGTDLGDAIAAARANSLARDTSASPYTARGSVIWLSGTGGLQLSTAEQIGSLNAPVILIVEGPVSITAAARIYGLVYTSDATLNDGHAVVGTIQGALVSAGSVTGNGGPGTNGRVTYNADILNKLQKFSGTFVRVPGSWRDFP